MNELDTEIRENKLVKRENQIWSTIERKTDDMRDWEEMRDVRKSAVRKTDKKGEKGWVMILDS